MVSEKEGKEWANRQGYLYFETSAQSGENIPDMFKQVFAKIVRNIN